VFHGAAGKEAREAFAREFAVADLPTTEEAFLEQVAQPDLFAGDGLGDRWRAAIAAAVEARTHADESRSDVPRGRVSRAAAAV
jgi:hypothetical protein